jgi:hypothetical protein
MSRKQLPTCDGRFGTLEAVLNHYSNGVKDSPTLDPILNKNGQLGFFLIQKNCSLYPFKNINRQSISYR